VNAVALPKLLIDVSRLVGRLAKGRLPTGIDRVCLAYVERFAPAAQAVLQWKGLRRVLPGPESGELFSLVTGPSIAFLPRVARLIAGASLSPAAAFPGPAFYVNVGHTGLEAAGLERWLQRTSARGIFMVHDLIPITHPEYCRPGEAQRHRLRMRTVLRSAAGVVTNSRATLHTLTAFAHEEGIALPKAMVAPLAPAELIKPDADAPLSAPYFVVLGTIEPRKNHLMLMQAWRELVARRGTEAPHLVVIGRRGWECENVIDFLERCPTLRGFVHELSECTDRELAAYLGHARALLFPSFVEGYGIPLVEALRIRTPVIATDLPVFHEIAGDVPDYVDALDGLGWINAVVDYSSGSSPRRQAQLERLASWASPTWDAHFRRFTRFMEELDEPAA
jgi:glycosyltransferase involved in cell wall biosynthesis